MRQKTFWYITFRFVKKIAECKRNMTVKILGQISWENKICVFFIFSNGGITEMTKIETEWQNAEQERQEDFIQHEPPEVEFVFYNQVQQGDVASVEKNLKSGQYRHIAMKTRLSTDLVEFSVSLYYFSGNGNSFLHRGRNAGRTGIPDERLLYPQGGRGNYH